MKALELLFVSLGGALGAIARFYCGWMLNLFLKNSSIPLAMMVVNIIGSFGLGCFFVFFEHGKGFWYMIIAIGFFGAFTTFSTFTVELSQLLERKLYGKALFYLCGTTIGSIIGFIIGFLLFH